MQRSMRVRCPEDGKGAQEVGQKVSHPFENDS
jgi:hypothetical protein